MVICRKVFHVFIVGCYMPVAPLARDFGVAIHLHGSLSHGISIALIIHSLDRTLEEINPKGWCAGDFYRTPYSVA